MKYHETIESRAVDITRLRNHATAAGVERDVSLEGYKQWQAAWAEFNDRYDDLAFLGGASTAHRRMRCGDAEAIEYALCFIEIRPYFFRSGYMYNHFLRILRNCELTEVQRMRYNNVYARYLEYRLQQG